MASATRRVSASRCEAFVGLFTDQQISSCFRQAGSAFNQVQGRKWAYGMKAPPDDFSTASSFAGLTEITLPMFMKRRPLQSADA